MSLSNDPPNFGLKVETPPRGNEYSEVEIHSPKTPNSPRGNDSFTFKEGPGLEEDDEHLGYLLRKKLHFENDNEEKEDVI